MMPFIDLKTQYKHIKPKIMKRIETVLEHGQYILGPEVEELERELAAFVGCEYAITMSNGTDALMVPMMAMGIGPGDEVITSAFSFFATAEMISLVGATPVFVDIDPATYTIDVAQIEKYITPKTKAIVPVSLYGQTADMDALSALAKKHNLYLIEDGAQSFGATYKGRKSCNLSHVAATSFFPAKPLGCYGDGGAIFTNDSTLAKAMKEVRNQGQEKRYYHTRIGMNGRLDTLQCAILLEKLAIFPEEIQKRERIAQIYLKHLASKMKVMTVPKDQTCVWAQFTMEVDNRDQFQKLMQERGIPTSVHYPLPMNKQPVYQAEFGHLIFEHTDNAAARVVSIPMHPYLTDLEAETIAKTVLECVGQTK